MKYITTENSGGVRVVTMNYERENRFNPDMIAELMETLDAAEKDKETGALVFTGGDPKFFSNGLDLGWLMAHAADTEAIVGYLKLVNSMFKRVCLYPKPVVAALNGHTFAAAVFLSEALAFGTVSLRAAANPLAIAAFSAAWMGGGWSYYTRHAAPGPGGAGGAGGRGGGGAPPSSAAYPEASEDVETESVSKFD